MNIYIDIETLRAPEEVRKQILKDTIENFKAPSSLTKTQAAKDLGLTDANEIKFTSASDMIARWEKEMAEVKAGDVATEKWQKTSFDPCVTPIACICIGWFEGFDYKSKCFDIIYSKNEMSMLNDFHRCIDSLCSTNGAQIHKPKFIGHNIAKFDLPFIWKRSVINNVKPADGAKWIDARHDQHCYDTMIAWAGFGNRISADNLAKTLGVNGKTDGMDGSLVYDTWQTDPQKVIDYCHDDVALVKSIHERLTF